MHDCTDNNTLIFFSEFSEKTFFIENTIQICQYNVIKRLQCLPLCNCYETANGNALAGYHVNPFLRLLRL